MRSSGSNGPVFVEFIEGLQPSEHDLHIRLVRLILRKAV